MFNNNIICSLEGRLHMYEITYTCQKSGFVHKLHCALLLNGLMRVYEDVELKLSVNDYYVDKMMIKEKGQPFSIRDFINRDPCKGEKVLVSVKGAYMNEQELAERICIAMTTTK